MFCYTTVMNELYKVVIHVEESNADAVRQAIGEAGGGKIGNYTHCSFSIKGTGRFLPGDGANPTVGEVGQLEAVAEERIEVTCDKSTLKQVVAAIKQAHSYEEPTIDIYPLLDLADI